VKIILNFIQKTPKILHIFLFFSQFLSIKILFFHLIIFTFPIFPHFIQPFQGFFSRGGKNLTSPIGGSANGTPKKERTRLCRKIDSNPRKRPAWSSTSTGTLDWWEEDNEAFT